MKIRAGYDIEFACAAPTPMMFAISVHQSRRDDLLTPHTISVEPEVPVHDYLDGFGNVCSRLVVPAGTLRLSTRFEISDSGLPDPVVPDAPQDDVADVPDDVLVYLLGSRYCDTDRLSDFAWSTFGGTPFGWGRVQAICEFVHGHIAFDYQRADPTRSAYGGYLDRTGVCRDFAHLAITFCRAMNIPARYCTGYLGDIGVPAVPDPMDFSAWFQAWLGGRWHTFDARHNRPRIGRILMATGRDATDVAISTSFGRAILTRFDVVTDEVQESSQATSAA